MKKIYTKKFAAGKALSGFIGLLVVFSGGIDNTVSAQNAYTFTPAGATGSAGPTQAQVNTAYAATNLSGSVTASGGIQTFTIPSTGPYRITAIGAQGGYNGGSGASIAGDFTLTAGTVLKILVGQQGTQGTNGAPYNAGGGGGGSFVTDLANVPYVVAGGGGGNGDGYSGVPVTCCLNGMQANTVTAGAPYPTGSNGGTAGGGGNCTTTNAGGGAGIYGNGSLCNAGSTAMSFTNGGLGGQGFGYAGTFANGGFGGGGGQYDSGTGMRGGGGGGYSGGGGGYANTGNDAAGGGGGSFNAGVNQTNAISTSTGSGRVIVQLLCNVGISASTQNTAAPTICAGNSLTLTTNAASNISWNTGSTAASIVVSPSVTTTYSLTGTSAALSCSNAAFITVTVNAAAPVLSISNPSNNICLGKAVVLTASGALTYTWTNVGVVNGQTFMPTSTTIYTVQGQNGCGITTGTTQIVVAPIQVSAIASPTSICQGYTTALSAVSPATTYTWFPGGFTGANVVASPTVNTIYTVSVSDGTCSGTQTVLVNTVTTPTIVAAGSTNSICAGQSVTLSASGAGANGTYSWTTINQSGASVVISPTVSATYNVIGTNALGCSASAGTFVIVGTGPSSTITAVSNKTLVCAGSSATLVANGPTSYTWAGGPTSTNYVVTPTSASSIYTLSALNTGNGCISTNTFAVFAIVPNVTATPSLAICIGSGGQISVNGANTYALNGGVPTGNGVFSVSPTASTVFTVVATTTSANISCPVTKTIPVTVNALPTVSVTSARANMCKGESNVLTGTGASSYTWNTGATTTTIAVTLTVSTNYTVTGADANGCENTYLYLAKVLTCAGISEVNGTAATIRMYPNPATSELKIYSDINISAKLLNSLGQQITTLNLIAGEEAAISVKDLSNGVYFLTGDNGTQHFNQKVIVAH